MVFWRIAYPFVSWKCCKSLTNPSRSFLQVIGSLSRILAIVAQTSMLAIPYTCQRNTFTHIRQSRRALFLSTHTKTHILRPPERDTRSITQRNRLVAASQCNAKRTTHSHCKMRRFITYTRLNHSQIVNRTLKSPRNELKHYHCCYLTWIFLHETHTQRTLAVNP